MTVDDLMKIGRAARTAYIMQRQGVAGTLPDAERAATVAIVRALRDGYTSSGYRMMTNHHFDEILGDAGEKLPDYIRTDNRVVIDPGTAYCTPATDPTVGQRLIKAAKEAAAIARGEVADAAPAVCDIKELVKRLRTSAELQARGGGWADPCSVTDTLNWNAALALEALAGERDRLKAALVEQVKQYPDYSDICRKALGDAS